MATFIDPAAGSLANAIGELGTAFVKKSSEKNRRMQEIINDPERQQSLAAAFRFAGASEDVEQNAINQKTLAAVVGLPDEGGFEFLQALSAGFPASSAEGAEAEARKIGLGATEVRAAGGSAEVVVRETGARLGGDAIETEAERAALDAEIALLVSQGMSVEDVNLSGEARRAALRRQIAEDTFGAEVFGLRTVGGLAELTVDTEALEFRLAKNIAELGIEQVGLEKEAMAAYRAVTAGLGNSPEDQKQREAMAYGLMNPSYLNYLNNQDNIDARALALSAANGDPADQMAMLTDYMKVTREARDRFIEADGDPALEGAAIRELQALSEFGQSLILAGAMPVMDLTTAIEVKRPFARDSNELVGVNPEIIDRTAEFEQAILNGEGTIEELADSQFLAALSKEARDAFLANVKHGVTVERAIQTTRDLISASQAQGGGPPPPPQELIVNSFKNLPPELQSAFGVPVSEQTALDRMNYMSISEQTALDRGIKTGAELLLKGVTNVGASLVDPILNPSGRPLGSPRGTTTQTTFGSTEQFNPEFGAARLTIEGMDTEDATNVLRAAGFDAAEIAEILQPERR